MYKKTIRIAALLVAAVALLACASPEKKAGKAISEYLRGPLCGLDGYEAVGTVVDSCIMTPVLDARCRAAAKVGIDAERRYDEAMRGFDEAVAELKIWNGGWDSHSRAKYREAFDKANGKLVEAGDWLNVYYGQELFIKAAADSLDGRFVGWEARHGYRFRNADGATVERREVFVLDPKMKTVLSRYDADDLDEDAVRGFIRYAVTCNVDSLMAYIEEANSLRASIEKFEEFR